MSKENSGDSEKSRIHDVEQLEDVNITDDDEYFKSPEEFRLVRRLDRRIMPLACLLYLCAYLDRSNIGNARLQGLPKDVLHGDPTGVLFDWVTSAFYFSYILCQVPATITSKLFSPRLWVGCAAIGWGICSVLMSSAFNFPGLMVARIGLGAFEAGFGPAIPLYFSFFYTRTELGLRMGYWFGFAAVAGAFGGLIAFGVQHAHAGIENWRLLFIIEGSPAIILGVISLFYLPDRPESATMFNEDERRLAIERMNRSGTGDVGFTINRSHIIAAAKDWKIYMGGVIYFGLNTALASISAFLPTIIETFGFTDALAQLLTVPPYAVAAIVLCMCAFASDRLQNRGFFMAAACVLGGIGYLLLLLSTNVHALYFATFCITSGTYTTIGLTIAWYAHNLGSETKKATGIPMFMAIGQCGSVLGSHIYPSTEGPRYVKGFAITCALLFLAAIICIILSVTYIRENRRRDEVYGLPAKNRAVDTSELADDAPTFRYIP